MEGAGGMWHLVMWVTIDMAPAEWTKDSGT
jgi:hypothetical protein